jgi:hypothetical protein
MLYFQAADSGCGFTCGASPQILKPDWVGLASQLSLSKRLKMLDNILHHRMFTLGLLFLAAVLLTLILGQPPVSGAGLFQSPTTEPEVFDSPLAAPVTEEFEVDLVSGTLISPVWEGSVANIPSGKIPAYRYDFPVVFKNAPCW